MVRMAGENSISAGPISLEHRCCLIFSCAYISFGTCILLCYLSVGSISGYYFLGGGQAKEESVPLFAGKEMVAI